MVAAELGNYVSGVEPGIVGERLGDDLQRAREGLDDELLLANHGERVVAQRLGDFHLNPATAANDGRALALLDELLRPAPEDDGGSGRLGAALEDVEAVVAKLLLLEDAACAHDVSADAVDGVLNGGAGGLAGPDHVCLLDAAGGEDVAISEELRGDLVVQNGPLGVDDALVLHGVLDEDLGVLLLGLELELDVDQQDLGVEELLGLLLRAGVGEGLLEGHALDEQRVAAAPTGDLLDANHVLVEVSVEQHDGVDDHFGEEGLLAGEQLRVERGLGALGEEVPLLRLVLADDVDGYALDVLQGALAGDPEVLDDDLGTYALHDKLLRLREQLAGENGDGGGPIAHLVVLRLGDIDQHRSGGVGDVEQPQHRRAVVRDGDVVGAVDELVHAPGTERRFDAVDDDLAGVDVADYLRAPLGGVCALLQEKHGKVQQVTHLVGVYVRLPSAVLAVRCA
ncbi:uncharacterized protein BcabD6B2_50420 [Babesia caballi]|uniref:Uncharacterized protein n=1 Tax=Babesia caballi TaxID=5871 RepID=A0AAV4M136_BABCB|nr:hypothetical protein, conserved [Babesia caballi]